MNFFYFIFLFIFIVFLMTQRFTQRDRLKVLRSGRNSNKFISEGALSIEVWGHRSAGFSRLRPGWEVEQRQLAKARGLADRWAELTRKIQLWVQIQELNDQGEYAPVEVKNY